YDGDVVQGDSVSGARQLVSHLISHGHRRIGMVTETGEVSTARDRLEGYKQALADAGIEFRPELIREAAAGAIDVNSAYAETIALLDLPEPPTAVFSVNNIAVVGVAEAIRERGFEIPRDLSVVSFAVIEHA